MKIVLSFSLVFIAVYTYAQTPFNVRDSIDANNINALSLVHGDMWWDEGGTSASRCSFPAGSGKHINFVGALWMGGYDGAGQLHIAAQTYRQSGNDYWPGPLDGGGALDYATSDKWAKIWKIRRSDIDAFLALPSHTETNTPQSILTWPAKGNAYAKGKGGASLSITADMAPFKDNDGDGIYNPLNGDYPAIRGEQTLWYVFSDNGPTHSQTGGTPLKVEVHSLVYAYNRGTLIDNVVYYDYTIVNKSSEDYSDFRLALWDDVDLGYYLDDYIGFDSGRRLAIAYNATDDDGLVAGHPANSYGPSPPATGVTFVSLPGDGDAGYVPTGSFMFYLNNLSMFGHPSGPMEYRNYMTSKWRTGVHLKYDSATFDPFVSGYGGYITGEDRNYAYPDDPSLFGGNSECNLDVNPGDRKFVLASNSFTLRANSSERVVMALVVADGAGGCPSVDLSGIKEVADTAWQGYEGHLSVADITEKQTQPLIYPNPAHDKLFVDLVFMRGIVQCSIYNVLGQQMYQLELTHRVSTIDVSDYPPGVYYIQYSIDGIVGKRVFVKE